LDFAIRGQIGLSEDEQKKKQEQRFQLNGARNLEGSKVAGRCQTDGESCCQDNEDSCCCQNDVLEERREVSADHKSKEDLNVLCRTSKGKGVSRRFSSTPTWLDSWEQEDTYAALAVVCAAVSVAIAYSCYKQWVEKNEVNNLMAMLLFSSGWDKCRLLCLHLRVQFLHCFRHAGKWVSEM